MLLTPPIRSPLPAPRAGLTLSFPATGTFGQLPQLLTILGRGGVRLFRAQLRLATEP